MATDVGAFPSVAPPAESDVFQILVQPRRPPPVSRVEPPRKTTAKERATQKREHAEKAKVRPGSYPALGLNNELCTALHDAGYGFSTPIQRKVIPHVLAGDDVVAMARTGSGKTAAFLAPLLHRLAASPLLMSAASRRNGPRALVVAPTRELVLQTMKFCRLYSKHMQPRLRTAVVVGGTPLEAQFEALAVCPEILFATPGRLLQLLSEMGAKGGLTIATAETVVFDEADRLFEGTLAVETAALIAHLRNKQTETIDGRQTILISATMPHALAEFSRTGLRKSLSVVRLDADRGISPTLAVAFLSSRGDNEKDAALQFLVRRIVAEGRTVVVFAATHRRVEYLTELLRACVCSEVSCIHGNLDQLARLDSVGKFRKKLTKVLVVTDVAARGIDLPELDVVVNYNIPATPKLFVHRVGRVGRAGRFGLAFNLVTAEEIPYMLDIFLFVGRGVSFAERRSENDTGTQDAFSSNSFAIDTSFVIGALPKSSIDEEVEVTRHALEDVDLDKAYRSAKNAQGLYTKTRGVASGESVRRGKELFANPDGSRRSVHVHPWFSSMESAVERSAAEEAARLSVWRPKECMVLAPSSLTKRKRQYMDAEDFEKDGKQSRNVRRSVELDSDKGKAPGFLESLKATASKLEAAPIVTGRVSARQAAIEEERKRFFLPARQDANKLRSEKALKVKSGGAMGDGLNAFRELQDAAMDLTADVNSDLLRSKHIGSSSAKYWDRVAKKYVKGGVTSATSKRNIHVATREAKARARAGESYGTEDGVLFKKWLSKNKKAVEQLAERVDEGNENTGPQDGLGNGFGSNDFRKGAFGRRARVAAAAKNKHVISNEDINPRNQRPELRSTEEIKKARKLKAKAEARQQAHLKKKGKGGAGKRKSVGGARPQRGASKSKLIVRKK